MILSHDFIALRSKSFQKSNIFLECLKHAWCVYDRCRLIETELIAARNITCVKCVYKSVRIQRTFSLNVRISLLRPLMLNERDHVLSGRGDGRSECNIRRTDILIEAEVLRRARTLLISEMRRSLRRDKRR